MHPPVLMFHTFKFKIFSSKDTKLPEFSLLTFSAALFTIVSVAFFKPYIFQILIGQHFKYNSGLKPVCNNFYTIYYNCIM